MKVDLKSELFTYDIDERAVRHAKMMDGKLLLVTNAPELTPEEVVQRYALSCAAGYNLRWLLRAIVRLGLGPAFCADCARRLGVCGLSAPHHRLTAPPGRLPENLGSPPQSRRGCLIGLRSIRLGNRKPILQNRLFINIVIYNQR